MKLYRGYSLIELLVTIAIMLIVLSAVYLTYISLLKGYKKEGSIGSKIMEEQIGLEIIRKDILLAGLGIEANISPVSISGTGDNITLNLLTTQMVSSDKLQGYLMLKFDNSTSKWSVLLDKRVDTTNNNVVVLDGNRKKWTTGTITSNAISQSTPYPENNYVAFGYPVESISSSYNTIEYKLGGTPPSRCNPSTKNLIRNGQPVVNCVKGFKVYFGADTNNDGSIDSFYDNLSVSVLDNSSKIYENLQTISFYILTHEGGKDNNYNYGSNTVNFYDNDIGANVSFSLSGVSEYAHYRWKVLKISSKTINIRGVGLSD